MPVDMKNHQSQYPSTFYRVSLKAVIRNYKDEILVNKEGTSDTWNLPGGGWDHGETEHAALARELKEEVGYTGRFTAQPSRTAVFWLESKQAWLLWIVYDVHPDNFDFSVGEQSSEITFLLTQDHLRMRHHARSGGYMKTYVALGTSLRDAVGICANEQSNVVEEMWNRF